MSNKKSIYNFSAKDISGKEVSLAEYKDSVLLIVNTASKCGFTPQYEHLEDMYKKYNTSKFKVLGFPCNQFGSQESGDEQSIKEGCLLNYGVTFPMFSKVNVNGDDALPLYKFLKKEKSTLLGGKILWNFTKFLVDKEGNVIERYLPTAPLSTIEKKIKTLL